MLSCKNLTISLAEGRVLVDHLSFSLPENAHLGVIAEEGNGKSTLLKLFAGEHPDYVRITGSFFTDLHPSLLRQQLDEVWMNCTPIEYLLCAGPDDEIAPESWNRLAQVQMLCAENQIDYTLVERETKLSCLSGGEKVRLMFLKMLMEPADLYLLDEPGNDLDLDAIFWMGQWISSCDKPVIFISHDIQMLQQCASCILHLEARNKKTKPVSTFYPGGYDAYLLERSQSRKKQAQIAAGQKREYQAKKQRLNDLKNKVESKLNSAPRSMPNVGKNLKDKMRSVKSSQTILERQERVETDTAEEEIHFFFPDVQIPASKQIWLAEHETLSIDGRVLIDEYSLEIHGKDKLVITGVNGSGKTLLLKQIAGQLMERTDLNAGYMPQHYEDFFEKNQTPLSFLMQYCQTRTEAMTMLGSLHFTAQEQQQPVRTLSGGQKAKLYLAMLALRRCNVLLLDEPTRNLSPLSVPVLCEALNAFQGCIIAISHDRTLIDSCFNRRLEISGKRLIEKEIRKE